MLFRRRSNPWKAGIIYFDPKDPRIVVPNRFRAGWTLNLANRWSWAIAGGIAAAVIYSRR